MAIQKIVIRNFKGFKGDFSLELNPDINILVGDNETGKSTILQAIHLALTGYYEGRSITKALSPYLFNLEIVHDYIKKINSAYIPRPTPPEIIIEITFDTIDAKFEGNGNLSKESGVEGVRLRIALDEIYKKEYEDFIKEKIYSLPVEYYKATWTTFARETITTYGIPIKSVLIDSSTFRYQNGSDVFLSRVVRDVLDDADIAELRKVNRQIIDQFQNDTAISGINDKIKQQTSTVSGPVELRADQGNMEVKSRFVCKLIFPSEYK